MILDAKDVSEQGRRRSSTEGPSLFQGNLGSYTIVAVFQAYLTSRAKAGLLSCEGAGG